MFFIGLSLFLDVLFSCLHCVLLFFFFSLSIYLYFSLTLHTLSLFVRLLGLLETMIPPDPGLYRRYQPKSSRLPPTLTYYGEKFIETVQNSTSTFPILTLRSPQSEHPGRILDYNVFRTSMFNNPHRICKLTPRKQRMCVILLTLS